MDEEKVNQEQLPIDSGIPPVPLDEEPQGASTGEQPEAGGPDGEIPGEPPAREPQPPVEDASPEDAQPEQPTEAESSQPAAPEPAPSTPPQNAGQEMAADLKQIRTAISEISSASQRSANEIREMHRLYHNEFAGRLKSMQDELEQYHNADRGKAFDGILSAIARIYSNNETLIEEIEDLKTRKHVQYMLLDLSDLLEEYGVLKLKSEVGEKRNTRHCQIVERIPTEDPTLHDTIAASHNTGFYKDNRTIIKELVDVYFFDKASLTPKDSPASPVESEQNI